MTRALLLLLAGAACAAEVDVYSRPRQYERSHDYDVIHYRIELEFDEAVRAFRGRTRITLAALKDGFDTCVLDAETFTVSAVRDESGGALAFTQKPGTLTVRLRRPYKYREQLAFTVAYQSENTSVDPEKHGMPRGYPLGPEFQRETNGHPAVITTMSFPAGARHWFPCYDHPGDKATSEVIATVRDNYQAISNGRLVRVTHDASGRKKTFYWSQEKPHSTYLFVLVAGPYVKIADTGGSLPVNYWVYPRDAAAAQRSFGRTREILQFFEREFDYPYPWAKYDQITIPGIGGGAESTTATVVGESAIHDEKADKDFPTHWLVAHEAAHQWWGDLVTMRDWSEAWINESFATWADYLWAKHSLGEDEGALNLWNKKNQYFTEARTQYRRPIVFERWETPNQNFDRHSYQKGAAVLEMLRWRLGEDGFRRSIAHFLRKHAYQPVDTHDLLTAIREATGESMELFFEQWIYGAGHPVFEVGASWAEGEKKLRLSVAQKQTGTRVPVFQTPVAIGITTAAGKRVESVRIARREEAFTFDCAEKPLLVRFDEGDRLPMEMSFPKPAGELVYQLEHDDALGRMWAAGQLKAHTGESGVAEALRRAAVQDRFWAVRREALLALPVAGDAAFLQERARDPKSDVRAAALRALGARKERSLASFFAERFRVEDSYVAQAEALRALGACGDATWVPFLREAGAVKSPRDMLWSAAQAAIESVRAGSAPPR